MSIINIKYGKANRNSVQQFKKDLVFTALTAGKHKGRGHTAHGRENFSRDYMNQGYSWADSAFVSEAPSLDRANQCRGNARYPQTWAGKRIRKGNLSF